MRFVTTLLVSCVAALLALGMVMLYSSSMVEAGSHLLVMQLTWCGCGLAACLIGAFVDYRILKKFSWLLLPLSLLLLAAVLIPSVGTMVNGSRRWFSLRGMSFQPSELAKLALIISLAHYGERYQRQMHTFTRGLLMPGIMIAVVLGLIFIEPDRGTTILLAAVSSTMLLLAGIRWRHLVPPMILAGVALAFSLLHDTVRQGRIDSWLHLEASRQGKGYQAWQAMVALGSGGWSGLGLGNGRQKLGFVPEHHTDFILSIIGEELGLFATLLLVAAFAVLVICGLYIAWNSNDTFGLLLGSGLSFLIGLQAFINIGVVTSALPNKGLSLPFISYGGSNLLVMLTCVGLLLSIAVHTRDASLEMPATLGTGEVTASLNA